MEDLDRDPPIEVLQGLAERTGTELAHLRTMTLVGCVPWLFDCLDWLGAYAGDQGAVAARVHPDRQELLVWLTVRAVPLFVQDTAFVTA